ncbi:hypothetical protein QCM80_11105 [Bradyrhizobium sp. SSUT112]|uniref:hypothetical protein n=1 Tax=Bradyrhizobium sp. SSUT112 TaxID=3040604 RepID=UPI002448216C|nr:hypothetical protein [Bradyrhizobium sp. SSUT112]MDH2351213.1 hypothetical protein [Bradyrhizobium sp. SSUT112]
MVRLFVAVTDKSWFDQLSASAPHDDVNFWQSSGTTQFRALQPGELFLFKLHAPNNFIVGGGIFGQRTNPLDTIKAELRGHLREHYAAQGD